MATREELYPAVWTEPLRNLAKRFQVSDSYLARVCDSLNVPRPDAGYWAKKDAGKVRPPAALPAARAGEPTEWHPGGGVLVRRSMPRAKPATERGPKSARPKTHGLIQGAMGDFLKTRKLEEWGYLKPYKRNLVDITVSQTCLEHALTFANALFLALEAKGHRISLIDHYYGSARRLAFGTGERPVQQKEYDPNDRSWVPRRLTVVHVDEHMVGLAIVEVAAPTLLRYVGNNTYVRDTDYVAPKGRSRHAADTWTITRDCPTGRLRLVAYAPHCRVELAEHWQENGKSRLLARLPDIVAGIEAFGAKMPALDAQGGRAAGARAPTVNGKSKTYTTPDSVGRWSSFVVKLSPQPQPAVALGLRNTKPSPSPWRAKSISVPSTSARLSASTKIRTPSCSNTASPSRRSRARSATWPQPEQPLRCTPKRRPSAAGSRCRKRCTRSRATGVRVMAMAVPPANACRV